MFDVLAEINWIAVLIAALAYFMLGGLWFTPLFGKVYDRALGIERSKGQKWPAIYYIGPLVSSVVVTIATAILIYTLDIVLLSDALTLGLVIGVGYAASISVNNAINPKIPHPQLYGAVTGTYHIAGILIVSAVLVSF